TATELVSQQFHNVKPQSGATDSGFGISAEIFSENMFPGFIRYAAALVFDFQFKFAVAIIDTGPEIYVYGPGIFDGIGHQVADDLLDTYFIAFNLQLRVNIDLPDQVQPFYIGQVLKEIQDMVELLMRLKF